MAKILIIEDDPFVRRFYEKLFRFQKYEVEQTGDAYEGLELAQKGNFDLILLDIIMPKINGLEILKKLKANEKTKNIKTIMLTNIDDAKIAKEAASLGAFDFMIKSQFDPEELLKKINEYLTY